MSVLSLFSLLVLLVVYVKSYSSRYGMSMPWDLVRRIKSKSKSVKPTKTLKNRNLLKNLIKNKNSEYNEIFYDNKLDHFSPADSETFKQRILINSNYYQEGGPIFFYCGNEGPIEDFYSASGFIYNDLAKEFNALVIFAEHRFFGKSWPDGQTKQDHDIKKNKFLTVEQALTDFTIFIQDFIKEQKLPKLTPVIAFGGSYGGMLAAWGRMKFPHVFAGAVASSAPILLFEDINKIQNSFFRIVTETYKRYDENCIVKIREGFDELFKIRNNTLMSHNKNLIKELNNIFHPCSPIKDSNDIKKLESTIEDAIVFLAQYNYPYDFEFSEMKFPGNPAKVACSKVNNITNDKFSNLLSSVMDFTLAKYNLMDYSSKSKLKRLKAASDVFFNNTGELTCLDIGNTESNSTNLNGWDFLACTEMIMPMQKNGITDMFNPEKWSIEKYANSCNKIWHGDVRPEWAFDFFGGRNYIKETINYSNVFYINGKMDPWNSGCPQVSHNPKVNVFLADSAHHLDLRDPNPKDPKSIIDARNITKELIKQWILEYITSK